MHAGIGPAEAYTETDSQQAVKSGVTGPPEPQGSRDQPSTRPMWRPIRIRRERADKAMTTTVVKNKGWTVTFAGMGINLSLGVLYAWSVIKKAIPAEWGWDDADKALPYSIACITFALMTVPAGRLQDRIGLRWVATAGGLLTGLGCIVASFATSVLWYVIGFGFLAGAGIGLGYAAATPPAVKWFPAKKTGLIAGIVVAGFGLASVYISPLAT